MYVEPISHKLSSSLCSVALLQVAHPDSAGMGWERAVCRDCGSEVPSDPEAQGRNAMSALFSGEVGLEGTTHRAWFLGSSVQQA